MLYLLKRCTKKNTIIDYAKLLIGGYIPAKKNVIAHKRPFNPGNPNEFELKVVAVKTVSKEENLVAPAVDDNGVAFNKDLINRGSQKNKAPVPIHIF